MAELPTIMTDLHLELCKDLIDNHNKMVNFIAHTQKVNCAKFDKMIELLDKIADKTEPTPYRIKG
tara:strand:- start:1552 stop:1746 length:195 start_codon:yes stop_codon:yes gene_type:complete